MANVVAVARNLNLSAQKARLVADMVRGLSAEKALSMLKFVQKKAARAVHKVLKSALYNAENNHGMFGGEGLMVKKIYVDQGSYYKRSISCAKGRGSRIKKPHCHITVELH